MVGHRETGACSSKVQSTIPSQCRFGVTLMPDARPYKPYQHAHDEYPQVLHEDVMSNDAAVLDWLEKIVR